MLKIAVACAFGATLSFLGTLGFAEDARPPHQDRGPIRDQHHHHPPHNGLNALHLDDVTSNQTQEVDRLYSQLQPSTAVHRQSTTDEVKNDGQEDQNRLAKLIDDENRLLDRQLQSICRGC